MLKRICDKCGKEMVTWFQINYKKIEDDDIIFCGKMSELCEDCFDNFKEQLANNN